MASKGPENFIKQALGRIVTVKLNSGTEYIGILATLDGNMNVVLEQIEEYENGELKNKFNEAFIRGNNDRRNETINIHNSRLESESGEYKFKEEKIYYDD